MTVSSSPLAVAVVCMPAYCVWRLAQVGKRHASLPPGPPTVPVLGNLHLLPPRFAHLALQKLGRQYGPVISLKLFGHTMIAINNAEAMYELMDKRNGSFPERPPTYVNDEVHFVSP